jgi:cellulose synthase/poly-beta-1,6-N-acetylglucosamine synthase-like glycosyltransferase
MGLAEPELNISLNCLSCRRMMLLVYITTGLLLLYGALLLYYHNGWQQLPAFDAGSLNGYTPALSISVIIPARNEEANIGHCLTSLLQQYYPPALLEIIVVNDHSTDRTAEIVQSYAPRVRLINLQYDAGAPVKAPKKRAIEKGIAAATGQWIVTTDADCVAEPAWIGSLAAYRFAHPSLFIAAPVKIKDEGSLLAKFQALDFLTMQGITGASVYRRLHNMCNGANLAYERQTFYDVNGFDGIDTIASGDDMLLMHKIAQRHPLQTAFIKSREAIVTTLPAASWRDFFQQRIRWASKATHYKSPKLFLVLLLVYLTNLGILATGLLGFFYPLAAICFGAFWLGKFLLEIFFVKDAAAFFKQQYLLPYLLLLQPLHMAYIVISGFFGQFKTYQWKGRKLK